MSVIIAVMEADHCVIIQLFRTFKWLLKSGYPKQRVDEKQKHDNCEHLHDLGSLDIFSCDSHFTEESQ